MLPRRLRRTAGAPQANAEVFAALGDATRLALVTKLSGGRPCSIAQLTRGSRLTRQAITKHLRVLGQAGLVRSERAGRERRFRLDPEPLAEIKEYLAAMSRQWDQALARLKSFVER